MPGDIPDKPLHNMDRATWDMVSRFNQRSEPTVADITPEHEQGWAGSGWSPEAIEMIKQLHSQGLPIRLAAIAARDIMGLNTPPESEWETFEREQPIRANTKKLLVKGARGVRDVASAVARPLTKPAVELEKLSAAKLLKDYLQVQDAQRAEEQVKQGLWMIASMPQGVTPPTPLAPQGQSMMIDPTTRIPVKPY